MTRQVILTERQWVYPTTPGATIGKWEYINPQQATFHQFAQTFEQLSDETIHYPVAIVELVGGTVEEVSTDRIRFINPI